MLRRISPTVYLAISIIVFSLAAIFAEPSIIVMSGFFLAMCSARWGIYEDKKRRVKS